MADSNTLGPGDAEILNKGYPAWFDSKTPNAASSGTLVPIGHPSIVIPLRTVIVGGLVVGLLWWLTHRTP